jgi:hypothetical protein
VIPRPVLTRAVRPAALTVLLCLLLPAAACGWAGLQHVQIGRAAARNMPADAAAFRAFARPMAFPSIYPDLWKGADPEEGPRHYFEPDRLPEDFDLYTLSPNRVEAFATQIDARSDEIGVAPWTILSLLDDMTEAMRTNDWLWAARCGAAMSHYVADLHMPLHCTRNFNGQETWQHGIHSRWESDMTKAFFRPELMTPPPAAYLEDPFRALLDWVAESYALVPQVLRADIIAKRAADGSTETETYYLKLWELTGDLVNRRISEAAGNLSSIWYTAWINAGRPAIPEPFEEIPPFSVFSGVGIDPPEVVGRHASFQKQKFDIIVWVAMGVFALVVIGSSLHRGAQARKAAGK